MGKKLKYCSSCEEGFAERFAFCPDCGASLQTFEMNPVSGEAVPMDETPTPVIETLPVENEAAVDRFADMEIGEPDVPATESFSFAGEEIEEPVTAASMDEEPAEAEHVVEATAAGSYFQAPATDLFSASAAEPPSYRSSSFDNDLDDNYHLTVINDSNSREKNGLLLGATILMVTLLLTGVVVSIFGKSFDIGAIGDDNSFTWIPDIEPVAVDMPEIKQKKDNSGGGGGGGNEEQEPASKGTPPAMMEKPLVAPSAHMDRLTNPTLTMPVGVVGPNQSKVDTSQRYGLPNGADNLSDGPGSGGGIGTGRGGGVGSGNGSGLGSGNGGGAGSGNGGGIGDGDGRGGGPPPPIAKGESTPYKIIAKPRANYTDEARTNNVQGSVRLRITLLASGQVGSITPVTRLPYGLTEQAIAAAKQLRFEPKKVNGIPQSTIITIDYGFNIY